MFGTIKEMGHHLIRRYPKTTSDVNRGKATFQETFYGVFNESISDLDVPTVDKEMYDIQIVRSYLAYQFGLEATNAIISPRIKRSKRTGRIGWLYDGDDQVASVRANDSC